MGSKRAREWRRRQDLEDAIDRARNQPRDLTDDVCIPGTGPRRLQFVLLPSFEEGHTWDVRQSANEWRVFRGRTDPTGGVYGNDLLAADSSVLKAMFEEVCELSLPLRPDLSGHCGADGETFQLAISGDLYTDVRIAWWSDYPEQWAPVVDFAERAMEYFSGLDVVDWDPLAE